MIQFNRCLWPLPLVVFTLIAPGFAAPPQAAEAPKAAGKAVTMIGRVLIRNEDKVGTEVRELKVGDPIFAGDVVNTRSDANVKLIMVDKSIIDLGNSTLFKVDEWVTKNIDDRKVTLSLGYGNMRGSVTTPVGPKGKFTIKTKAATMGVRGTEFAVLYQTKDIVPGTGDKPDASGKPPKGLKGEVVNQITVIHGKVEVRDHAAGGKPIQVSQGQQLTSNATVIGDNVQRGTATMPPPKLVQVTPEQMKTIIAEVKVQDQTFKQAVIIDTGNKNQPSFGESTLQAILQNAPVLPPNAPRPGDFGLPGTFVPGINTIPPNALPPGVPVNLQVTFVRN